LSKRDLPGPTSSRIRELQDFFCGSGWGAQAKFAIKLGIDARNLNRWLRENRPTGEICAQIVERTDCSAEWLLTGKGKMFGKDRPKAAHVAEEGLAYRVAKREITVRIAPATRRVILKGKGWKRVIDLRKGR